MGAKAAVVSRGPLMTCWGEGRVEGVCHTQPCRAQGGWLPPLRTPSTTLKPGGCVDSARSCIHLPPPREAQHHHHHHSRDPIPSQLSLCLTSNHGASSGGLRAAGRALASLCVLCVWKGREGEGERLVVVFGGKMKLKHDVGARRSTYSKHAGLTLEHRHTSHAHAQAFPGG